MTLKWKSIKRVLLEILLFSAIIGFFAGTWFIQSIGPWQNSRDLWAPYLSWTDDPATTITISFKTPVNVSTTIEYGTSRIYTNSTTTANTQWHSVTLTNLQPSTTYFYRIYSSDYNYSFMNVDYYFTTAPNDTTPFRFVVYGDNRPDPFGKCVHEQVLSAIQNVHPDFILNIGDIVSDASGNANGQWDRFFYELRYVAPYTPYMISMGNHEFYEGSGYIDYGAYYRQAFHFPGNEVFYSFNYSNAHFICLNLSTDEHRVLPGSPEYNFLLNDLSIANSSPTIDWIFVFFHVPLYSSGGHGCSETLIHDLSSIFSQSGVDMVFQGHDHHYERMLIGNITYYVLGGGGAELDLFLGTNPWTQHLELTHSFGLFEINGKTLTMQGIRVDGFVFDSITLVKGG
ncbi:MAG: purple acid phosphatase family protein [Candidatus Helarchaeota archaeon]